jgi:hypothetical protein
MEENEYGSDDLFTKIPYIVSGIAGFGRKFFRCAGGKMGWQVRQRAARQEQETASSPLAGSSQ